ncbi:MAG TPA: hypothetical protein VJQ57_12690 [Acidimicrobiia bacterium]|nr:hypothetical protein [Acidimicrobiia bacterium]
MNTPHNNEDPERAGTTEMSHIEFLCNQCHNGRTLQEAVDELDRELRIRCRLRERWVQEGRWSSSEAKDKIERHAAAIGFLQSFIRACKWTGDPNGFVTRTGDKTPVEPF